MADRAPRAVCIAGAGIAGLSLALALAKLGVRVTVLERSDAIQEFGAGLQISPNARRALNALGLDAAVSRQSFEPEGIDVYPFRRHDPIASMALGDVVRERYGLPYAVMHRADLATTLHTACRRFANIDIRFGVRSFAATPHASGVSVEVRHDQGETETIRAFALVGADGVGSRTRTDILGGKEACYSGYVAWRTLVDTEALSPGLSDNRTSLMWGPGFHAVAYPVPNRDKINIAVFARERMSVAFGLRPEPRLPRAARRDRRFASVLDNASEWTHWPLATVQTPQWHSGPIGLVGDAAHAMLPFQAQGAAMGIEDAVTLAPLLASGDSAESAFMRHEEIRRNRVERVARISAANGRIFHMRTPLAVGRDLVMRLQGSTMHLRRLHWLYSHDPVVIDKTTH